MSFKISGSINADIEAKGTLSVNGDSTEIGPITKTFTKSFGYPPADGSIESMEETVPETAEDNEISSSAKFGIDATLLAEANLSVNGGNKTKILDVSHSAEFTFSPESTDGFNETELAIVGTETHNELIEEIETDNTDIQEAEVVNGVSEETETVDEMNDTDLISGINESTLPPELEDIDVSESPEDMDYTLVDDFVSGATPEDTEVAEDENVITLESAPTIPVTSPPLTEELVTTPPENAQETAPEPAPSTSIAGLQCGAGCFAALVFFPFLALVLLISLCVSRSRNDREKREAAARRALAASQMSSSAPQKVDIKSSTVKSKVPETIPEVPTAPTVASNV